MSAKPTVATLAATVEQMAAKISALESQIEGASDGIAVQTVVNLVEERLEALLDKVAQLEATVSAQATEIERAHARLDSAREYLRTLRKAPAAPARRAQPPAQAQPQPQPPVEPNPGLRVYTHTQGPREGQSFQYWKDGGKTTMVRVIGPNDDTSTGLPKAPCLPDDLPPPQAAEPEPELVCPF